MTAGLGMACHNRYEGGTRDGVLYNAAILYNAHYDTATFPPRPSLPHVHQQPRPARASSVQRICQMPKVAVALDTASAETATAPALGRYMSTLSPSWVPQPTSSVARFDESRQSRRATALRPVASQCRRETPISVQAIPTATDHLGTTELRRADPLVPAASRSGPLSLSSVHRHGWWTYAKALQNRTSWRNDRVMSPSAFLSIRPRDGHADDVGGSDMEGGRVYCHWLYRCAEEIECPLVLNVPSLGEEGGRRMGAD